MVSNDRRTLMKGMAAASGLVALGASGSAAANHDDRVSDEVQALQNFSDTLTWAESGMQGSENARLCCPDGRGVWNWILTGGGATFLSAQLEVTFSDGSTETVDGRFPGIGNVAQFPVVRNIEECATVESAVANFSLDSEPMGNQVLTISSSECIVDGVPPKPPKNEKERKKYEKKKAKRKYLMKKLQYKRRKKAYIEAKKEYKKAKRKYGKDGDGMDGKDGKDYDKKGDNEEND